jgi:hypothetical protein
LSKTERITDNKVERILKEMFVANQVRIYGLLGLKSNPDLPNFEAIVLPTLLSGSPRRTRRRKIEEVLSVPF